MPTNIADKMLRSVTKWNDSHKQL